MKGHHTYMANEHAQRVLNLIDKVAIFENALAIYTDQVYIKITRFCIVSVNPIKHLLVPVPLVQHYGYNLEFRYRDMHFLLKQYLAIP